MKRILIFDTWLSALKLVDEFAYYLKDDFQVYFVSIDDFHRKHISENLKMKNTEVYNSRIENNSYYTEIIDLRDYDFSFTKLFQKIQFDFAITISLHNCDHRWFNYCAHIAGLKRIFIQHGIKGNLAKESSRKHRGVSNVFLRFLFYLRLFKFYFEEKRETLGIHRSVLFEFIELLFLRNKYKWNPSVNDNCIYDLYLVPTTEDMEMLKYDYRVPNISDIHIVGPIDLIGLKRLKISSGGDLQETVLFLGQPLVGEILTLEQYVSDIANFKNEAERENLNFIYRCHPRDDNAVLEELRFRNISFSSKSLLEDLMNSVIVVGYNSTALLTAQYLGKRVISLQCGSVHPKFLLDNVSTEVVERINIQNVKLDHSDLKDGMPLNSQKGIMENLLDFLHKNRS